jgi:hypothetical protein
MSHHSAFAEADLAPPPTSGSHFVSREVVPSKDGGIALDPNRQLLDGRRTRAALNRAFGEASLLVGMIHTGKDGRMMIVDTRDSGQDAPFYLVNASDLTKQKPVQPDQSVDIAAFGKKRLLRKERPTEPRFSVAYDSEYDTINVINHDKKRGTFVTGHMVTDNSPIQAQYTQVFVDDLKREGSVSYETRDYTALHGYYEGHPIIGSLSRSMRGGVYGTTNSEHMLVDNESPVVKNAVEQIMAYARRVAEANGSQRDILRAIKAGVAGFMTYDLPAVERLSSPHYKDRGIIHLSDYLKAGIGICRHQAVLDALVIEQAIEERLLKGTTGVQRNLDLEANSGHAWAVFRDEQNHTIIVDSAQDYVGTREETKGDPTRWNYYVSDESY